MPIDQANQQSRANYADEMDRRHKTGGLSPRQIMSSVSFYTSLIWFKSRVTFFYTQRQVRSKGWVRVFKAYASLTWSKFCDAFLYTQQQISSEGWLSIGTSVFALVFLLAARCGLFMNRQWDTGPNLLWTLLLLPYVASLFAWLLQLPFSAMGTLLNWALNDPTIVAISSLSGIGILKLLEHSLSHRIIEACNRIIEVCNKAANHAQNYWRGRR